MWSSSNVLFLWSLVAPILFLHVYAELFTAISDVEPLLEIHKNIIDDLDVYIKKEQERLKLLKKHLDKYNVEHMKAMEDIPNYLGNPINAFTLIKRLTTDLDFIEDSIKKSTGYIRNKTINYASVKYPTFEDLTGAAQALTRLQETYHLEVNELSEGKLNGVIYRSDQPSILQTEVEEAVSTPMSAGDCYELGRSLYNEKDYKHALLWMMEALRKFKEEKEPYTFTEGDILEHIGLSHYWIGDSQAALEWTKKLLVIEPKHTRAHRNIALFQKSIAEQGRDDVGEEYKYAGQSQWLNEEERLNYEALCRGEIDISPDVSKRLKCRYLTENHPFLKLAPIKMEQMYLKPDIVVFHDVLTDQETEHIKEMAKPRFNRAYVLHPLSGELVTVPFRISKSSWLRDEESPIVARVSQRIADFTGLSLETAEDLQVVNYGIGGHYEPHYDFELKGDQPFSKFGGNRIATVLFYMSDVAQGGATVFTELGLSVFPVARAAAFWLNLHPSGEGDLATRHAACPVLRGSKWVCNKWIHQGGQELIKPCDLEYQKEGIAHQIPAPVPKSFR